MTARTTLDALAFAANLVTIAKIDGIEVEGVDLYCSPFEYITIRLRAADRALTPALAVSLGLTERRVHEYQRDALEAFYGHIDGVEVQTQHTLPLSALDEADRVALGVAA